MPARLHTHRRVHGRLVATGLTALLLGFGVPAFAQDADAPTADPAPAAPSSPEEPRPAPAEQPEQPAPEANPTPTPASEPAEESEPPVANEPVRSPDPEPAREPAPAPEPRREPDPRPTPRAEPAPAAPRQVQAAPEPEPTEPSPVDVTPVSPAEAMIDALPAFERRVLPEYEKLEPTVSSFPHLADEGAGTAEPEPSDDGGGAEADEGSSWLGELFEGIGRDQTTRNLLIVIVLSVIFLIYRLRTGGSRKGYF